MYWFHINEHLPPIGHEVLILDPVDGLMVAKFDGSTWVKLVSSILYGLDFKPTHWMPIPAPPKDLDELD